MTEEKSCLNCGYNIGRICNWFFAGQCSSYQRWIPADGEALVDENKKLNARERYLAFKAEADEHFGGLNKAITDHVEGLEEIRKIDNQIITDLHAEKEKLKNQIKEFNENFCKACQ